MFEEILHLTHEHDKARYAYQQIALSPEYRIGKIVYKIPGMKFFWNKLRKYETGGVFCRPENLILTETDLHWKPKVAVYQAIIGKYDSVKNIFPLYNDIYDFYLYTDLNIEENKGWQIKRIPENIANLRNPVLINRYLKTHPIELFPEYDYAVYLDGVFDVVSDLRSMLRQTLTKTGVAMHRQSMRTCVYKEGKILVKLKKGNRRNIIEQLKKYRSDGFPKNWGLYEGCVIASDLRNSKSSEIFNLWWQEYLHSGSFRDQLSLPYVLWKNGYSASDIGDFGVPCDMNPKLLLYKHLGK
jgi:hypothetical protein